MPIPLRPLHFVSGIRALEAEMFRLMPSREVMRRAGVCVAERARLHLARPTRPDKKPNQKASAGPDQKIPAGPAPKILAVAGPGNNGGDALVAAAKLREWGVPCVVVFGGDQNRLPDDAKLALSEWRRNGDGEILTDLPDPAALRREKFALGLDGIFGVGLDRPVAGKYAEWIRRINDSDFPWLAIDAPSGLNADTGIAHAPTVRAVETATFLAEKPGLRTGDGPDFCGKIFFADLRNPPAGEAESEWGRAEIPAGWDADLPQPGGFLVDSVADLARVFPAQTAHKGGRGTLALVGGARGMEGALVLAARAAAGLGTGKIFAISLAPGGIPLDAAAPEVMWREEIPASPTAVGIGPGLGKSAAARTILGEVLESSPPLVADADALNLIAEDSGLAEILRKRQGGGGVILTPHPAEAGRLLGVSVGAVQADRIAAARELSGRFGADVVLKGAGSVLAFASGGGGGGRTGGVGGEGVGGEWFGEFGFGAGGVGGCFDRVHFGVFGADRRRGIFVDGGRVAARRGGGRAAAAAWRAVRLGSRGAGSGGGTDFESSRIRLTRRERFCESPPFSL